MVCPVLRLGNGSVANNRECARTHPPPTGSDTVGSGGTDAVPTVAVMGGSEGTDGVVGTTVGAGNLLGNLLCAVTGLLDGFGLLAQLVALLNQILSVLRLG